MTAIKMIYSDKILSEQKKKVSPKEALEKRLNVLSEYMESHTDKAFSEFLKEKGITKAQFVSGLPVGLKNPPANDIDALTKYMGAMNFVYTNPSSLNASGCGCSLSANGQPCECPNKEGVVDGGYVTGEDSNVGADGRGYNAAGDDNFPLVSGSMGEKVTRLQMVVRNWGGGSVLFPNGILDSITRSKLNVKNYTLPLSESDYNSALLGITKQQPQGNVGGTGLGGYIPADHNVGNWMEMPTYEGKSESDLRWALGKANDYYVFANNLAAADSAAGNNANKEWNERRMDEAAFIVDLLNRRIDGDITASQARNEFTTKSAKNIEEIRNMNVVLQKKFFQKVKDKVNEITAIAKQNWGSIVTGLRTKTFKEILADLKREVEKSKSDLQKNITLHNANKYNPVFVVARKSFQKLLELNVFNLAAIFNRMKTNPDQAYWNRAKKKWDNLGGTLSVLESSINAGKDKPKQLSADGNYNVTGAEAGGLVAALTAATVGVGAAVGMAPATIGIVSSAGGVVAVMIPILAGFKKGTGPGPDTDPNPNPEFPTPGPAPDSDEMTDKMKVIIASSIGGTLLIVAGILMFGGKGK